MKLDRYFDTVTKRQCAFLIIVATMMLLAAIQTFILGSALAQIKTYDDLFSILKTDLLSFSYISRCIYGIISLASMTPGRIVEIIFRSLHFFEVMLGFLLLLFVRSNLSSMKCQRYLWFSLDTFLVLIVGCSFCVIAGLQASSLLDAIQKIQWIGFLLFIQAIIQISCCIICIYLCIKEHYMDAMHTEMIIIEEK